MSAQCLLFLISADPSLGRIDKHSLSQQTLMELLIENITNREKICGDLNEPQDVSEWKGLRFNDRNDIVDIYWGFHKLKGPIELKWLPHTVKEARFLFNKLTGSADLTCLPDVLVALSVAMNRFEGTVDLTQLPGGLEKLFLGSNGFCGLTDFSQLPKSLTLLDVQNTQLEGEIVSFKGNILVLGSKVRKI